MADNPLACLDLVVTGAVLTITAPPRPKTLRAVRSRVTTTLTRSVFGHPLYVWVLWASAATVLAACPMMLSEPAMWFYLMDPELLALIVIIGVQYTRLELGIMSMRIQAEVRARATRPRTQSARSNASPCSARSEHSSDGPGPTRG